MMTDIRRMAAAPIARIIVLTTLIIPYTSGDSFSDSNPLRQRRAPEVAVSSSSENALKGCEWVRQGCYEDSAAKRILSESLAASGGVTPGRCQKYCEKQGMPYAGLEYGAHCYCSRCIGAKLTTSENKCDKLCHSGNNGKLDTCGGVDALELFACFQEGQSPASTGDCKNIADSLDEKAGAPDKKPDKAAKHKQKAKQEAAPSSSTEKTSDKTAESASSSTEAETTKPTKKATQAKQKATQKPKATQKATQKPAGKKATSKPAAANTTPAPSSSEAASDIAAANVTSAGVEKPKGPSTSSPPSGQSISPKAESTPAALPLEAVNVSSSEALPPVVGAAAPNTSAQSVVPEAVTTIASTSKATTPAPEVGKTEATSVPSVVASTATSGLSAAEQSEVTNTLTTTASVVLAAAVTPVAIQPAETSSANITAAAAISATSESPAAETTAPPAKITKSPDVARSVAPEAESSDAATGVPLVGKGAGLGGKARIPPLPASHVEVAEAKSPTATLPPQETSTVAATTSIVISTTVAAASEVIQASTATVPQVSLQTGAKVEPTVPTAVGLEVTTQAAPLTTAASNLIPGEQPTTSTVRPTTLPPRQAQPVKPPISSFDVFGPERTRDKLIQLLVVDPADSAASTAAPVSTAVVVAVGGPISEVKPETTSTAPATSSDAPQRDQTTKAVEATIKPTPTEPSPAITAQETTTKPSTTAPPPTTTLPSESNSLKQLLVQQNAPSTAVSGSSVQGTRSCDWRPMGCRVDQPSPKRLLGATKDDFVGGSEMTLKSCQSYCESKGHRIAGLEYGFLCFCGDCFTQAAVDSNECSTPCLGAPGETCGGNLAISLYACFVENIGPPDQIICPSILSKDGQQPSAGVVTSGQPGPTQPPIPLPDIFVAQAA